MVEQVVVHAVETDQQDPLEFGFFQIPGPFDETQQGADGEGQEIENGQEKGGENEKKRADESETGPRADIAEQRQGRKYDEKQKNP